MDNKNLFSRSQKNVLISTHLHENFQTRRRVGGSGQDDLGVLDAGPPVLVVDAGHDTAADLGLGSGEGSELGAGIVPLASLVQAESFLAEGGRQNFALCSVTEDNSLDQRHLFKKGQTEFVQRS
jgi:hypothetical protein